MPAIHTSSRESARVNSRVTLLQESMHRPQCALRIAKELAWRTEPLIIPAATCVSNVSTGCCTPCARLCQANNLRANSSSSSSRGPTSLGYDWLLKYPKRFAIIKIIACSWQKADHSTSMSGVPGVLQPNPTLHTSSYLSRLAENVRECTCDSIPKGNLSS